MAGAGPDGAAPTSLFCENETNTARLYGSAPITPYPKDGINDHVVDGAATVNPERPGTKCAFWYQVRVAAGRDRRAAAAAAARGRAAAARTGARRRRSTRVRRASGGPRPTSSTRS